jgi:ribosomal protein S18 acetylase RimI-like enzyme
MAPTAQALRAATDEDAEPVVALLAARERAVSGRAEVTVADVRAEWDVAAPEPAGGAWVVDGPDGLAGYALLSEADVTVAVHPDAEGGGLGTRLREAAEERARAGGVRVLRQYLPASDLAARAHLLSAGWWPAHHYFGLRRALDGSLQAPAGRLRAYSPEDDAEPVWHLVQGAFAGIEGHLPQTLESWRATGPDSPGWDAGLCLLRHDEGGIAGVVVGEVDGGIGRVVTVAVASRARGRGHGRALLSGLLVVFAERGLGAAEAAVHGPTAAAAGLFESVGMTVVRHAERWEKVLG